MREPSCDSHAHGNVATRDALAAQRTDRPRTTRQAAPSAGLREAVHAWRATFEAQHGRPPAVDEVADAVRAAMLG